MKQPDSEQRVRPIPIKDDDGVLLPAAGGPSRNHVNLLRRPWMPLVVSGVAVTVLFGAVTFFGAVEFQDPPTADPQIFSLTTAPNSQPQPTLPPLRTLEEMIPGITERLTLVTTDGDSIWTFVWDPTFSVPKEFAMRTPTETEWNSATFETSGRLVAVTGLPPAGVAPPDAWIAAPSEFGPAPYLQGVWSATWHATDVARLAYVSETDAVLTLETIDIDLLTKTASLPSFVTPLDDVPSIVRWDDGGFILQTGDRTVALDGKGTELWSAHGFAHAASPNLIAQVRPTEEGSRWFLVDRASGDPTSVAELGIEARPEYTSIVASSSSDLFAAATYRDDRPVISRTSITVVGPSLGAPRIVQVDSHVVPLEFTADAEYLILQDVQSQDLVFVDWQTGASHWFDIENGHRVLAIYVG